jgi:chemotaxis family two-component system response regulator Rcp1
MPVSPNFALLANSCRNEVSRLCVKRSHYGVYRNISARCLRSRCQESRTVRHILLAEDNPADVYLLREALSLEDGENIDLTVVSDGEEAMKYIEQGRKRPDLIVLDLNLPKSDGGDVLRCIRDRPELHNVPVVILTSSDSPKDKSAIERLGASCYLTKPSELDAFLALGRKLVNFCARNGESSAAHP